MFVWDDRIIISRHGILMVVLTCNENFMAIFTLINSLTWEIISRYLFYMQQEEEEIGGGGRNLGNGLRQRGTIFLQKSCSGGNGHCLKVAHSLGWCGFVWLYRLSGRGRERESQESQQTCLYAHQIKLAD